MAVRASLLLACLAVAACGSSPPAEVQRTTGALVASVPVPDGFEDLTESAPPQVAAGVGDGELERFFLAGTDDAGLPVQIVVATIDRPELLPAEAIAARQAATTVDSLARFDARAGTPESLEVAGVPAARYDVRLRAESGARIHQRFVIAKRPGERRVHMVMLSAPSRALFRRHLPAFDAMLDRWRWSA